MQWGAASLATAASAPSHAITWPWRHTPAIELRPQRPVVWQEFLGVNAQLQWFSPAVARQQVGRLKALGLTWVRLALHWMLLEPQPGQFKLEGTDQMMALVKEARLKSIVYMVGSPTPASSAPAGAPYADKYPPRDPQVYAQRLSSVAQRYPNVDVWQVWNEPNIPAFWQPKIDPAGYARLLLPAVQALRAVVPTKPVAMAGMAYYSQMAGRDGLMLEDLGKLGAYQLKLIVAYHPYTDVPEGSEPGSRDFLVRATQLNARLRAVGAQQIWATEWGWSSYAGPKEEQPIIGEQGQAEYTLKRLALMAALDYDRIFLFTLSDLDERAGVRDRCYGLLRENGDPKSVYHALLRFLSTCGPRLEPDAPPKVQGGAPAGLVSIGWKRPDGQRLCMLWADEAQAITLSGARQGTLHQPLTGTQRHGVSQPEGLRVQVDTRLQILLWA
ncbi:cellulase family glycosylhydrolase [Aquabacterium sp.]|uniref:cellulase family glycosylhydrolase n=1 Tax=Aquabacterium sp. TaxID=1872578 RepID=UPI0019B1FC25|nr:cellulase family glycosylhydrolase [Aquabacterium sp.]MBC7701343.1 cellulase family glycosylhydrolase [Aquabacterium sp.]